jgi:hypothetical protein
MKNAPKTLTTTIVKPTAAYHFLEESLPLFESALLPLKRTFNAKTHLKQSKPQLIPAQLMEPETLVPHHAV